MSITADTTNYHPTTKVAAYAWLNANIGRTLNTEQTRPGRNAWVPGPRTLEGVGRRFTLNGSHVADLSARSVTILSVSDDTLIFHDTDWSQTTRYEVAR